MGEITEEELARLTLSDNTHLASHAIDPQLLERCCPLDNGRLQRDLHHTSAPSNASLSLLGILPNEVFCLIFEKLDVPSLTNSRAVSSAIRAQIDRLPLYSAVHREAPVLLRSALATGIASWSTIHPLYDVLRSSACTLCGDFRFFVNVIAWRRICPQCVNIAPDAKPVSRFRAMALMKRHKRPQTFMIKHLPGMKVLPGCYTILRQHRRQRNVLFDYADFHELYNSLFPSTDISLRGFIREMDFFDHDLERYMAVVSIPFTSSNGIVEHGVLCRMCITPSVIFRPRSRTYHGRWYSRAEYEEHLDKCERSQQLLKELREGTQ